MVKVRSLNSSNISPFAKYWILLLLTIHNILIIVFLFSSLLFCKIIFSGQCFKSVLQNHCKCFCVKFLAKNSLSLSQYIRIKSLSIPAMWTLRSLLCKPSLKIWLVCPNLILKESWQAKSSEIGSKSNTVFLCIISHLTDMKVIKSIISHDRYHIKA